jgi:hypothetical protein
VLFDQSQNALIEYPAGRSGGYEIPNGIANIGVSAFQDCANLTSVTIPDSVTNIEVFAFVSCVSLTNVTIGNHVTSIGIDAFGFCTSLASVTIPDSVSSIGSQAFSFCSALTNVTIGRGLTNIGNNAFTYLPSLTRVNFTGNAPLAPANFTVFDNDYNNPIAYRLPDTTGWGADFDALPTALWLPQIQTSDAGLRGWTNPFGFNITWASGRTVVVEACTNLANHTWSPVHTNILAGGCSYFSDPQWTNYPARLYRLRSP